MKNVHDILIAPVITEKSNALIGEKVYTFRVASDANKPEIADAVEKVFKVKVKSVRTVSVVKKPRRVGVHSGYKSGWKKAYVKLTDDSKTIEFFEGMN
jgi:large subunit ribosomal protein L23